MHIFDTRLQTSPTDLANFLACRQKTALDALAASGHLPKPIWHDPLADVLRERGDDHERRYVAGLRAQGLTVVDLRDVPREDAKAKTVRAMRDGADVVVQAALGDGTWLGYADVLRKVNTPCPGLGEWSYEAEDAKLTRETRGGTILQLCVYTQLVAGIQQRAPEHFHVVTPAGRERYRVDDFAAFYRQAKAAFFAFLAARVAGDAPDIYPEPVEHCDVCRWSARCTATRRHDDHLSFVANLGRQHQVELGARGVTTLAALAVLPLPLAFNPVRGAKDTYERLREQARVQLEARTANRPVYELLPVDPAFGLARLPEPRSGDLFLDLEGDPFARPVTTGAAGEGGREYLFGLGRLAADGTFAYSAWWAATDAEERAAFEAVMADIMRALDADPAIHVYHYAPYEPSAFKRLMGRYATCEADVDRLLRGGRFVDLFGIARRAMRAGVESYSIKNLEPFYGFQRDIPLEEAGAGRRNVEFALETNDMTSVTAGVRAAVEGYNKDDCRSVLELQRWLESLRASEIARGVAIARPSLDPVEGTESVQERDRRVVELRTGLLEGVVDAANPRTPEERARYLLAYLVDWHRREERVAWGEYHRTREKSRDELLDEPGALAGLEFVARISQPSAGTRARSVVDRYTYPAQENDLRAKDDLRTPTDEKIGSVSAVDKMGRTIDIKKTVAQSDVHPDTVIVLNVVSVQEIEKSLQRIAASVIDAGIDDVAGDPLVNDLLLARAPRLKSGSFRETADDTSVTARAIRTVFELDRSLLAIQGPPGAGKTFTGAQMIAALVDAGRKVGVVATGHKVIRKLLVDAGKAAAGAIPIAHKPGDDPIAADADIVVDEPDDNAMARSWLAQPGGRVLGGTSWLWARAEFAKSVDVLFVDEAGQMALANVLAVAPAADNLVLLGDPQQLEQPQRGTHPEGVDVSALDHLLAGHQTMPPERGLFLPVTWRLSPAICEFTSEVFYESKLTSKPGLEHQRLTGAGRFDGSGLFVVDVAHDGCRNASDEEASVVAGIIRELFDSSACWIDEHRVERPLVAADILVVAPYNAHVARLSDRLAADGDRSARVRVGTVDKFQGQQAPVVIYSMATSRPEDAPRGMEFLYSLNRLNVATSRAKCACILVLNPRLFEPECRTPRQMHLANALARYREMATRRV